MHCPVEHGSLSYQKTSRSAGASPETSSTALQRDAQGVWQVHGFEDARTILRSSATRQAGFNAEQLEKIPGVTNKPILYMEGKAHQQQRKQTARFFTPKTVSSSYRQFMETLADQFVNELKRKKRVDLSQLSLKLAVQVAAQVVGVTNSRLPGMDRRLDAFFQQQPSSQEMIPLLHWKPFARLRQLFHQRHVLAFYWLDVRPAIRARKRQAEEDEERECQQPERRRDMRGGAAAQDAQRIQQRQRDDVDHQPLPDIVPRRLVVCSPGRLDEQRHRAELS